MFLNSEETSIENQIILIKRDGREVSFDSNKIFQAILSSFVSVGRIIEGHGNEEVLDDISTIVSEVVAEFIDNEYEKVTVEQVQEVVIDELLDSEYNDVAKEYIKYSERKKVHREISDDFYNKFDTSIVRVKKNNGREEAFQEKKLRKAIMSTSFDEAPEGQVDKIVKLVVSDVEEMKKEVITTRELHNLVEKHLREESEELYAQYLHYRQFKNKMSKSFNQAKRESDSILFSGDNENANKDSDLNSTKQTLIAENIMSKYMRNFEMKPDWISAHDEGWLYIHDLSQRYLRQKNCCLFDMGALLKGGFMLNGAEYFEPKSITSALAVIGDVTLQASGQQLGGQQ